ncbi:MAG: sortase [Chloroflexota bacterium]|nr:sortase [Chloroflexota bacterium]
MPANTRFWHRLLLPGLLGLAALAAGCQPLDHVHDASKTAAADLPATARVAESADAVPTEPAVPAVQPADETPPDPLSAAAFAPEDQERFVIPIPKVALTTYHARSEEPQRIVMPSIALDSQVTPLGIKLGPGGVPLWQTAAFAVGHHEGTAFPGEAGNMVLSGHISSPHEGAVFHNLPNVKVGDAVIVTTSQAPYLYRITDVRTTVPTDVEILNRTTGSVITLITCVPDGVYTHRLVVRGEAV